MTAATGASETSETSRHAHAPIMSDPDLAREGDDLVRLSNDAMRARRRPGAILAVWAYEGALALLIAWPIAAVVRAAYGGHPRGDAPLWTPGGEELLDLLMHARAAVPAVIAITSFVALLSVFLGLVPAGSLLASIGFATRERRGPSMRQAIARAVRAFSAMALVLIVTLLTEGLILLVGGACMGATTSALTERLGEARADQIGWLLFFLFVLPAVSGGVLRDLSFAAVIRFRLGASGALRVGVKTLRRSVASILWSWAWRALAGLIPVAIGSLVAEKIGGRGGAALFGLAAIHQAVVVVRVALRASWLAKAMRTVDAANRAVTPLASPARDD